MSKLSEHPIIVVVGFLAALAGIATYLGISVSGQNQRNLPIFEGRKNSEWWLFDVDGKKPNLIAHFVDKNSISEINGQVFAWTMVVLQTPQLDNAKSIKVMSFFDCNGNTSRHTYFIKRYLDKTNDITERPDVKFQLVAPNTVGQRMLNFVCFGARESAWRVATNDPYDAMKKLELDKKIE